MPELPEVETIKNELSPHVLGKIIAGVTVIDSKIVQKLPVQQFVSGVTGRKINSLERRGKYLIFHLENGKKLIFHLRMTGSLIINPCESDKYIRIIFQLDNGDNMVFTDRRRLGVIWLADNKEDVIRKMGIEPFDEQFTVSYFKRLLKKRTAPIKAVLLDQHFLAGVGNMYADEALFLAGIHPEKTAGRLTNNQIDKLHSAIKSVLQKAIDNKGASVDTYRRPDGVNGTAQEEFKVAHQLGKPCPVCGRPIQRIAIRNRGSYFCPHCQRK
jgi:formamidopyrimidine-DNA glycosylase